MRFPAIADDSRRLRTIPGERYLVMRVKDLIAYMMGDPGSQLMYGSDRPLVEMGPYVRFLEGLGFAAEAREQIAAYPRLGFGTVGVGGSFLP